ncbi:erythromycin biosynthesis sensory transduction protein eryC1 [Arthrobacter livingstonensis]|uniref:Erythromycin biosynthesis sensory transduction protein eryC1 n=1 Tax=Arthrobacter livingstonensis TaxID=670078 RepID=A0A2V5L9Z1_9MICC|nr:DegT/DnrJ/EryC1/StrS family aminotransferase [Arthrobacter livingstonensis]PYI68365.1 erythromycin biosynthesis sensory transduction protein eryC1 [Arthrobacter livingstonensis]
METIPLVDLQAQQADIFDDIRDEIEDVLRSAAFIGGPAVGRFEQEYADFTGTGHCIGTGNGTDALELALRACGVKGGDEVILPANTFVATAEAVARIGAVPVLVDVDPEHLLIDPDRVANAVTPRTRAIVPVHLFGQLAPMERILEIADLCGAVVVEDAAQSQGARRNGQVSGSFGRAAATSFYPGKNLGAAGDAGAVTTSDPDIAAQVRMLGGHGSSSKYVHDVVGMNSRLDTIQAVVLRAKLRKLTGWNALRRGAAARYGLLLVDVPGVTVPASAPGNEDVWHLYVVQVDNRDAVLDALHAEGIGAGIHYPTPVHLTKAFSYLGRGTGDFPVAEAAAGRILSMPIFPHITAEQQERVVGTLAQAIRTEARP